MTRLDVYSWRLWLFQSPEGLRRKRNEGSRLEPDAATAGALLDVGSLGVADVAAELGGRLAFVDGFASHEVLL